MGAYLEMKKIAIISATGIGDIITLGPLTRKLKQIYPDCAITIFSSLKGPMAQFRLRYVDAVKIYNPFSIIKTICFARYDLMIGWGSYSLIKNSFRIFLYKLLIFLFPAKNKIVYSYAEGRREPDKNQACMKLDIIKKIGLTIQPEDYSLFVPFVFEQEERGMGEFLQNHHILPNDRVVAFHVGSISGSSTNVWSPERWAHVAKLLHERDKARIIFIGGKNDISTTKQIISILPFSVLDCTGSLSLPQTTALINRADLFLSTNSGPMWLAAALHKPQVALCGPSGIRWEPLNQRAIVLREIVGRERCKPPCERNFCFYKDNRCMNDISIEAVMAAIRSCGWPRSAGTTNPG